MTVRGELPDGLPEVFGVRAARDAGATPSRLRAADLDRSVYGVRVRSDGSDDPFVRRCRALAVALHGPFAFSHTTAARLHGLPLPRRVEGDSRVHVTVTEGHPRRRDVVAHRVVECDARVVRGLPVTSVERTWCDLATMLTEDELVAAGDHLVRRRAPPSTIAAVSAVLESARGRRGAAAARRAFARIRPGTDSPAETRLRLLIVGAGLPEPVVGHVVTHEGYWVGTPDLAYPQHRVALEYQGAVHRDQATFEEDVFRLERFHDASWEVLQVTARDLRSPSRVLARLAHVLRERTPR